VGSTPRASPEVDWPQVGHTPGFTWGTTCPRWGHRSEARVRPHSPPCPGFRISLWDFAFATVRSESLPALPASVAAAQSVPQAGRASVGCRWMLPERWDDGPARDCWLMWCAGCRLAAMGHQREGCKWASAVAVYVACGRRRHATGPILSSWGQTRVARPSLCPWRRWAMQAMRALLSSRLFMAAVWHAGERPLAAVERHCAHARLRTA
jgi:hypothetical protein